MQDNSPVVYETTVRFQLPQGVVPSDVEYRAAEALLGSVRPGGMHAVSFARDRLNTWNAETGAPV